MIYRISLHDDSRKFSLVFEADYDATFLQLNDAILEAAGYSKSEMTSFFILDDNGERESEITMVEMGAAYDEDPFIMEETHLQDMLQDKGQKLEFVFDPMMDRSLKGSLSAIIPGMQDVDIKLVSKKGKAPKQLAEDDLPIITKTTHDDFDLDADFLGTNEFDPDEMDPEGFGDLSFDNSDFL